MDRFQPYDPKLPPPAEVTIPIEEWRKYEATVSHLFDAEALLRTILPRLLEGRPPDAETLQAAHHFIAMKGFI